MARESGSPCCSAAARVKTLKVEPDCTPVEPPVAKLSRVARGSPGRRFGLSAPMLRLTAMALIWPVPGSTMLITAASSS